MSGGESIQNDRSVREYYDIFVPYAARVGWHGFYATSMFILGLNKVELARKVIGCDPQIVYDAYCWASMYEANDKFLRESCRKNEDSRSMINDVSWKDGVECEEFELRVSDRDGDSKSVVVLDGSCEENVEDFEGLDENGEDFELSRSRSFEPCIVECVKECLVESTISGRIERYTRMKDGLESVDKGKCLIDDIAARSVVGEVDGDIGGQPLSPSFERVGIGVLGQCGSSIGPMRYEECGYNGNPNLCGNRVKVILSKNAMEANLVMETGDKCDNVEPVCEKNEGEQDGNKTEDNRFVLGVKLLEKGEDRSYVEECDNKDSSEVQSNIVETICSSDLGIDKEVIQNKEMRGLVDFDYGGSGRNMICSNKEVVCLVNLDCDESGMKIVSGRSENSHFEAMHGKVTGNSDRNLNINKVEISRQDYEDSDLIISSLMLGKHERGLWGLDHIDNLHDIPDYAYLETRIAGNEFIIPMIWSGGCIKYGDYLFQKCNDLMFVEEGKKMENGSGDDTFHSEVQKLFESIHSDELSNQRKKEKVVVGKVTGWFIRVNSQDGSFDSVCYEMCELDWWDWRKRKKLSGTKCEYKYKKWHSSIWIWPLRARNGRTDVEGYLYQIVKTRLVPGGVWVMYFFNGMLRWSYMVFYLVLPVTMRTGSHVLSDSRAMKGNFEMDVIHESRAVAKWVLDQLGKYSIATLSQLTRDEFTDVKKQVVGENIEAIANESTKIEECVTWLVLIDAYAYKYVGIPDLVELVLLVGSAHEWVCRRLNMGWIKDIKEVFQPQLRCSQACLHSLATCLLRTEILSTQRGVWLKVSINILSILGEWVGKDDIKKHFPQLVSDLEDKINLRGMDCYESFEKVNWQLLASVTAYSFSPLLV